MKVLLYFVVCFIQLQTSAEASLCPENFIKISSRCVYLGDKTNWFDAVQHCSQLKTNISLINIINDVQDVTSFLLTKRNRAFDPITYQLPPSIYYGKKLNFFNHTRDMWLQNEPGLLEEESCMVILLNGTSLHAKMEKCLEILHNFICITDVCDPYNKICQNKNSDEQKFDGLQAPKMYLRKVNNDYILDVYNSQKLWNFTYRKQVRNPVCILEDGSTRIDRVCKLDLISKLSWNDRNITAEGFKNVFKYSITKDMYKVISETTGYLSCQAYIDGTMEKITSNRIIYRSDRNYHVFAVGLVYRVPVCSIDFCEPTYSGDYWETLAQNLTKQLRLTQALKNLSLRPIKMINRTDDKISLIFRANIRIKNPEKQTEDNYNYKNLIKLQLELLSLNDSHHDLLQVLYIRSSRYCHGEITWPTARVGQIVLSMKLCIDANGNPAKRKCTGNFVEGSFWSDEINKFQCLEPSTRTDYLYNLYHKGLYNMKATETLIHLQNALVSQDIDVKNKTRLTELEINLVAKTMENLKNAKIIDTDLPIIANITDSVMKLSASNNEIDSMKNLSQIETTNASNIFLESIDSLLIEAKLNKTEVLTVTPRFVNLVLDIDSDFKSYEGIRGLAALDSYKQSQFLHENIVTIPWNTSIDHLLEKNISAAVFLPSNFTVGSSECLKPHINVTNKQSAQSITKKHRLIINMFWNDGLFKSATRTPSHIVSVTVDGIKHYDLLHPLILIFKNSYHNISSDRKNCVFWDFEAEEGLGNWSDIGCTLATRLNNKSFSSIAADICICTHFTHFGHLVSPSLEEEIDLVLDIITITGCLASLLGLLGIGLTAAIFPEWRRGISKKIQLNLSASLGILMSVFLVNAFSFSPLKEILDSWICFIMGIILHFSVISTFSWMLVAAWFQYLRLTKPLASRHRAPHILLKSAIFAWGFPFIPCGTLLIISPESYNSPQCYPTGMAHYASVMCPLAIIISLNVGIYVLIICSIFNLGKFGAHINLEFQYSKSPKYQRSLACRRLGTLIFLFFLLGLSWLFGIWKLSYLFCCTATLQGLAFFIFFVILEKNTRARWKQMFSRNKNVEDYPVSNRSSFGFSLRRLSHSSRLTYQTTNSIKSSTSFPLSIEKNS
ncbi:hypothetical protein L9F63_018936 [Diploptera punctata]|uniref:Uncharacterized protein n=1 Tax=Diploptera punctata TaxID=6984 RepID=A0AAD7ZWV9_DIPPU|nr:hypothetical protein L9F63_018936 [Diploptera punctata]